MTKLFLIPRQTVDYTVFTKDICPNCRSIEELSHTTTYDMTVGDRQYEERKITHGFDFSNPMNERKDVLCKNCGHVFSE